MTRNPASKPAGRRKTAAQKIDQFSPIEPELRISLPYYYPVGENPPENYLAGLGSPRSRETHGYSLDIIAAYLSGGNLGRDEIPWHELGVKHADAVKRHLMERYSEKKGRHSVANPPAVNTRLAAWRRVLRKAWQLGHMSAEDYQRAADVESLTGERRKVRRKVPHEDLKKIFKCCAEDTNRAAGVRDAAILGLMFGCGLRRFEATGLTFSDIEFLKQGWKVHVLGKRQKPRTVAIPIGTAGFLKDWLNIRGQAPGPLFYPIRKNGVVTPQEDPMTAQVGRNIVQKRFAKAGVPKFTPHDLRATATTIVAKWMTVFATMDWAGHDDSNTTKQYIQEARDIDYEIAEKLAVPYQGSDEEAVPLSWGALLEDVQ